MSGDQVPGVSDRASRSERPKMVWRLRVDQPQDRLDTRDAGADEDRRDDEQPGSALGTFGPEQECDPQWDCGQRIAEVVDQVGQQRDRSREYKDGGLDASREREHRERDEYRPNACV